MKILKISLVFATFLLSACLTYEQKQKHQILNTVDLFISQNDIEKTQYIIILPNQGCLGCITVAENFLKEHSKDDRCTFILTSVLSNKELIAKLGKSIIDSPNVYVDKGNFLSSKIEKLIYPIAIYQKKGQRRLYFQKPNEFAFNILEESLNDN